MIGRRCWRVSLPDLDATERLAAALSPFGDAGDVIALKGPLGAGKTAFARAFIQKRLGISEVPSPTFNLVLTYDEPGGDPSGVSHGVPVWHFDLYRLNESDDVFELGFEEALSEALSLIEWPERLGALLPSSHLLLSFTLDADDGRDDSRTVVIDAALPWADRLAALAARENWTVVEG